MVGKGLLQNSAQIRRNSLQILLCLGHGQNIGQSGQISCIVAVLHSSSTHGNKLLHGLNILLCQRLIDLNHSFLRTKGVHTDKYIYLAAADIALHSGLYGILSKNIGARHLNGTVQIAVIDAADFNGNITTVSCFSGSAIASHTLDQNRFLLSSLRTLEIKSTTIDQRHTSAGCAAKVGAAQT